MAEERAVNVIHLEAKGKEKMKEPEVMPIKKARVSEEVTGPPASVMMEEEGKYVKGCKEEEEEIEHKKEDYHQGFSPW